ncbi:MAG: hypothetical protein M0Z60_00860, partial [Nitrospiraceae bacterium]|nr:hypothetical protein [Nitrospiraceae bacterium]
MAEETDHTAEEDTRDKLPLDAKLLSDAVIELNISRRSVGLYPREHPITRESIERAFGLLEKLFEFRGSITLGIAKDSLIIDDNILERRNPVFREFALSLHEKGIAAVSFSRGVTLDELLDLHEIITARAVAAGSETMALGEEKGLRHILLTPLDISRFSFAEGRLREDGEGGEIWGNYISGLIEGTLADGEDEGIILNEAPEDIASLFNEQVPADAADKTYDRVITSYLRKKEDTGTRTELFNRFLSLVSNLKPELKQQFLRRALSHPSTEPAEAERLLGELTPRDIETMMDILRKNPSVIPESMRNLLDKLKGSRTGSGFFDIVSEKRGVINDIEIDENILTLFHRDDFTSFVREDYQKELDGMMACRSAKGPLRMRGLKEELRDSALERRFAEVMIELLDTDTLDGEAYLAFLTRISELAEDFLETGRFSEVSEMYNAVYSQSIAGRFRGEARSMIDYFFRSDAFTGRFMDAVRLWGRHDREGVFRLVNVQQHHLIGRLLDALSAEEDAPLRKFYILILSALGSNVAAEAVKRLNDDRWFVVRNMLCLIREAGGKKYADHLRKFSKSKDSRIWAEAVKALLDLNTPDSFSHVRRGLSSGDPDLRDQAIRLSGMYRCSAAVPLLVRMLEKRDYLGT